MPQAAHEIASSATRVGMRVLAAITRVYCKRTDKCLSNYNLSVYYQPRDCIAARFIAHSMQKKKAIRIKENYAQTRRFLEGTTYMVRDMLAYQALPCRSDRAQRKECSD